MAASETVPETRTEPESRQRGSLGMELTRRYGVIFVWIAVIVVFSILRPDTFATFGTVQTLAGSQAVLLIIALGLLLPLSAGEFDLSVAGVTGLSLILVGWLNVIHGWSIVPSIAVALAAGLLVGCVNAFFVVRAGVDSFIVTLGASTILTGAMLGINTQSTGGISEGLVNAVHTEVLGLPLAFYYGLAMTVLVWYVMAHTPLGRYLQFVGSGREVARLSGLRVARLRAGSLIASSFIAAIAGVVLAGWLGASDVSVANSYLLSSFAAAFLGASVIHPGRFNAWGTLIAVYFLVTGITGLQLLGLAGWIEYVFYGASLILAVTVSRAISLPRST